MNNSRLCEEVQQNLETQGVHLSLEQVEELSVSLFEHMFEILDARDVVDISSFGSFWRKIGEESSTTFFKPSDDVLGRINT